MSQPTTYTDIGSDYLQYAKAQAKAEAEQDIEAAHERMKTKFNNIHKA